MGPRQSDNAPQRRAGASMMDIALEEARAAAARGEIPVGAVVVRRGEIIARAGNRPRELRDPSAHAEILAIREAARLLGNERLLECDLYVTLEPCTMCAAAISFARIRRLYYGAADPKGGAVESGVRFFAAPTCHHAPETYGGLAEVEAAALLRMFFAARRQGLVESRQGPAEEGGAGGRGGGAKTARNKGLAGNQGAAGDGDEDEDG